MRLCAPRKQPAADALFRPLYLRILKFPRLARLLARCGKANNRAEPPGLPDNRKPKAARASRLLNFSGKTAPSSAVRVLKIRKASRRRPTRGFPSIFPAGNARADNRSKPDFLPSPRFDLKSGE